jgi:heme exporter protein C
MGQNPNPSTHKTASLILPVATLAAVAASMALMLLYAPTEAVQGEVQRIFYVHVPSAWAAYMAIGLSALGSLGVLARPRHWERWDRLAASCIELGVVFTSIVLITGPIWGRRVWGVWWVWDARLTSTLILWVIYVGYLLFRAQTPAGQRRARLSAVIAMVGALDIPVIHFSVIWWRTLHPLPTVLRPQGPTLPGSMLLTLMVSMAAFTLLFAWLLRTRLRLEVAKTRLDRLSEGRLAEAAHA